jgi:hypothetical protein
MNQFTVGMSKIDERNAKLQHRLNSIRALLPAKNALVESGPLLYRCKVNSILVLTVL